MRCEVSKFDTKFDGLPVPALLIVPIIGNDLELISKVWKRRPAVSVIKTDRVLKAIAAVAQAA